MQLNERVVLTGAILFGLGLVAGIAIGSATVSYTHLTLPTTPYV